MGARFAATVVAATLVGSALTAACTASGADIFRSAAWNSERDRTFSLPGGAAIAITPADSGDLLVRWRDPAGGWTAPRAAHHDDRVVLLLRARVAGPTLAAAVTYSPAGTTYDEERTTAELQADDVTVLVVCREHRCSSSSALAARTGDPPQVTPDGAHVVLTSGDGEIVRWDGEKVVAEHPSGLPDAQYGAGQPLLAPDGSLRALAGRREGGSCAFTLLTTAPGAVAFTEALRTTAPTDREGTCALPLETFAPTYVVVAARSRAAWFLARRGDRWRRVTEDPSGQVRYPRGSDRLAGRFARSGFWHWRELVASSPDGRSLVVQVHFPGAEQWSAPQVVARARADWRCIAIEPMPTYTSGAEDPLYVNLRCRTRLASGEGWAWSYPTAVSEDGRAWTSFDASGTGVRVGPDLYFEGLPSHRWTPDGGLQEVDLTWTAGQPDLDE